MSKRLSFFERLFLKIQEKDKQQQEQGSTITKDEEQQLPAIRPGRLRSTQQELQKDSKDAKIDPKHIGTKEEQPVGLFKMSQKFDDGNEGENFGSLTSASKALDAFIQLRAEQTEKAATALKLNKFLESQRSPRPPPTSETPKKGRKKDFYKQTKPLHMVPSNEMQVWNAGTHVIF